MAYNPATDQIEPATGPSATAANQESLYGKLQDIFETVQLAATEATILVTILPILDQMRLLLEFPHNPSYSKSFAVTPSDSADFEIFYAAVSVNFEGNVKMQLLEDAAPVTVFLRAGVPYPYKPRRVYATDTTATGIVLWR